ncbi:permease [Actinophytocola sp.]|uniref:permease n=1 Tax=Actinophytocola sp. TaxID=1872138 RepID=UPI00345B51A9
MPSMMCTCCAAPVAVSVRKRGVPMQSALAYWLGNPVLNPVVLVFMAVVLPWQFVTVRVITGVLLVFGVTMLIGRLAGARQTITDPAARPEDDSSDPDAPVSALDAARRFLRTLARLSAVLLPEYLVVVLLLGGLRGWLFPAGAPEWGLLAVLLFAVVGTVFVIPTAGEIPIIQGRALAGVGLGPVGALILTLPALSLPSMLMIRRAFPARVIAATGVCVAVLGLVGAGLLVVLS